MQFFNYIKVFLHLQDMVSFGVVASHDCEIEFTAVVKRDVLYMII